MVDPDAGVSGTGWARTPWPGCGRPASCKPWRVDTFKLSTDPRFEDKLVDVVGFYLDPPERAVVLCVDEKPQTQALDRTQPSLPMKPGRARTMTHDYKRHGTTTIFAALDTATGHVLQLCKPRRRHQEFLAFLNGSTSTPPRTSTCTWCSTT